MAETGRLDSLGCPRLPIAARAEPLVEAGAPALIPLLRLSAMLTCDQRALATLLSAVLVVTRRLLVTPLRACFRCLTVRCTHYGRCLPMSTRPC